VSPAVAGNVCAMERSEPTAPQPANPDFGPHNVLAVLPDLEAARAAIADLEHAGVEGNTISVLGRAVDEATEPETRRDEGSEADSAATGHVARRAGVGAAAGAGAGGVAGLIGGAVMFGIPGIGPAIGAGIWAATLGGAAAGAGVGFAAGGIGAAKESEAWAVTFEAVENHKVVVGVHSDDAALVERAAEVLREHGPERLEEFDAEGERRL
jgi:hypothetical protein